MNVHLIRTYYPHWSTHSGIHQFIKYIDKEKIRIDVDAVPMGENNFPVNNKYIRKYLRYMVKKWGMQAYDLNDLVAEFVALRMCRKNNIKVIHYLDGEHSLQFLPYLYCKLKNLISRPKFIATFHQPSHSLNLLINKKIIRLLDQVIVLSPGQMDYFANIINPKKISLILHGVDTNYFQPQKKAEKATILKLRCLTVGSWLRDYKTLFAVAELLSPYPEIEFHIVSSGIVPPSNPGNIYVYDRIDDKRLLKMYQDFDVLFLPLVNATANNVLLEAIACGLPVVSTDISPVRAYLSGREAILVPGNDPRIFADKLLLLSRRPECLREMSTCARARAMELSWLNIAGEYQSIYNRVIKEKA